MTTGDFILTLFEIIVILNGQYFSNGRPMNIYFCELEYHSNVFFCLMIKFFQFVLCMYVLNC